MTVHHSLLHSHGSRQAKRDNTFRKKQSDRMAGQHFVFFFFFLQRMELNVFDTILCLFELIILVMHVAIGNVNSLQNVGHSFLSNMDTERRTAVGV